jgi:hypothetical protein
VRFLYLGSISGGTSLGETIASVLEVSSSSASFLSLALSDQEHAGIVPTVEPHPADSLSVDALVCFLIVMEVVAVAVVGAQDPLDFYFSAPGIFDSYLLHPVDLPAKPIYCAHPSTISSPPLQTKEIQTRPPQRSTPSLESPQSSGSDSQRSSPPGEHDPPQPTPYEPMRQTPTLSGLVTLGGEHGGITDSWPKSSSIASSSFSAPPISPTRSPWSAFRVPGVEG